MDAEQWKDVVGFEGKYQVSDLGRVRNARLHVLKPQLVNSGYLVVHLYGEAGRRNQLVHRLVAGAFCPNPLAHPEVNHKDTDKAHNCADNLEWMTRQGNVDHAVANGRSSPKVTAIAVVGVPVRGGAPRHFESQREAEIAMCGKQSSAINHCFAGIKKTAYGYVWSRA